MDPCKYHMHQFILDKAYGNSNAYVAYMQYCAKVRVHVFPRQNSRGVQVIHFSGPIKTKQRYNRLSDKHYLKLSSLTDLKQSTSVARVQLIGLKG